MLTSRRQFIGILATALSMPSLFSAGAAPKRFPLAFSTLGCPKWDWKTVLNRAAQWQYSAIELRGLEGEMDLTKRPEFQGDRIARTLQDLAFMNLRLSDLGSSVRLHEMESDKRRAQMNEGKRYIDLAQRLKTPFIRVFGDRIIAGQSKLATVERIIAGLRELGEHAQGSGVSVLLETHGDFCDSPTLVEIMTGAGLANVGLVWDTHHTVVMGKEDPERTMRQIGKWVHHVHLKDSKPEGKGERYVLTGKGTMPLREIVQVLVRHQYKGYFSFEWEKAWHPEIEEPEIAFPQFAEVMSQYLREAGA